MLFCTSLWWTIFSLYICSLQSINVKQQQTIFFSLPNGWGLLPTHIKPGDYLLNHPIILFPEHWSIQGWISPPYSCSTIIISISSPKNDQRTVLLHRFISKIQVYRINDCNLYIYLIEKGIHEKICFCTGTPTVSWGYAFPARHVEPASNKPQEIRYVCWFFQLFICLCNNNLF